MKCDSKKNQITCRKPKSVKTMIQNSCHIRRVNEAHKYLPGAGRLLQHACDIFLAQELQPSELEVSPACPIKVIEAIKKFRKLDNNSLSFYLSAALVDNSENASEITSNAFGIFYSLHMKRVKRRMGCDGGDISDRVKRDAKKLWNQMKPEHKFPFLLLAYMNSICYKELDINVGHFLKKLPKIEKMSETCLVGKPKLKNTCQAKIKECPTKRIPKSRKKVTFNLSPCVQN